MSKDCISLMHRLLLKGIIDVNVPKFVSADMQLYKGIMQDLFPDVKPPQIERQAILKTFEAQCKKSSLQATAWFSEKVILQQVLHEHFINSSKF